MGMKVMIESNADPAIVPGCIQDFYIIGAL